MKKYAGAALFAALALALYTLVNSVLVLKTTDSRSIYVMQATPKNTLDVIFVGSSHAGMNIDNQQLWQEYGIASMNVWGGTQPIWNSYYYAKECIAAQNPKVLVVDVFLCGTTTEYSSREVAIKNTLGLPFGLDKFRAARESFPTWTEAAEAVWGLPLYHSRYDELTGEDLMMDYKTDMLYPTGILLQSSSSTSIEVPEGKKITQTLPLTEKNERYLRKLIQMCQSKKVPLVLICAPYAATEEQCMRTNSVETIAREYGVPFYNYLKLWPDIGIDPTVDFYDIGHFSHAGIPKYTRALGEMLRANYDLPDHRSDPNFLWNTAPPKNQVEPIYAMDQTFLGDGRARYIDTGVKLYENRYGCWTLRTRVSMDAPEGAVYLSCFNEDPTSDNRGMMLTRGSANRLRLALGSNIWQDLPIEGEEAVIILQKTQETYSLTVNGVPVLQESSYPCGPYLGNLLIGCQETTPGGQKFRFGQTNILNLEVYDTILTDAASWEPQELPAMPPVLGLGEDKGQVIYTLEEQFVGDAGHYRQDIYLDTGLPLYEEPSNAFTLYARVVPMAPGKATGNDVFFSCFSEDPEDYRGLLLRQLVPDSLNLVFGSNYGVDIPCKPGQPMELALVKDGNTYRVYADGQPVTEAIEVPCNPYRGSLLIGCQQDGEGNPFRFSNTHVEALQVVAGAASRTEVTLHQLPDTPLPEEKQPTAVAYTLPAPFTGNGMDRALDTGVMLYDVPDKDWTLSTTLTIRGKRAEGVFLSCFSEEPGRYRGFMIRQDQAGTLTVWLGNETVQIPVDPAGETIRLAIVKSGSSYTLYQNGNTITRLESDCQSYDGTLRLCCQTDAQGQPFRFSAATVDALTLQDGALDAAQAQRLTTP